MLPGTRPTVLLTLAVTGGTPNARRVGNVINVPDPTTVLMVPAATPARAISTASVGLTGRQVLLAHQCRPTRGAGRTAGRWPSPPGRSTWRYGPGWRRSRQRRW